MAFFQQYYVNPYVKINQKLICNENYYNELLLTAKERGGGYFVFDDGKMIEKSLNEPKKINFCEIERYKFIMNYEECIYTEVQ